MNKEKIISLLKWVTCGLLLLSAAILFLPYAEAGSMGSFNPIQMIQEFMKVSVNDTSYIVETVADFIVPVVLVFIAGLLLISKIRVAKCITASILSIGALLLYIYYLTSDFFGGMHGNETVGFWLNFILAIIGVVMPIVLIILSKKPAANKSEVNV